MFLTWFCVHFSLWFLAYRFLNLVFRFCYHDAQILVRCTFFSSLSVVDGVVDRCNYNYHFRNDVISEKLSMIAFCESILVYFYADRTNNIGDQRYQRYQETKLCFIHNQIFVSSMVIRNNISNLKHNKWIILLTKITRTMKSRGLYIFTGIFAVTIIVKQHCLMES